MNALIIDGKTNSPTINFNADTGLLKIIGRSIPEHPVNFYQPLENWLTEYITTNPKEIKLFIHLDYLNTHSTECILILMKKMEQYYRETNADVKVLWRFDEDDEDMETLGQDLSSITKIPFEIKEI